MPYRLRSDVGQYGRRRGHHDAQDRQRLAQERRNCGPGPLFPSRRHLGNLTIHVELSVLLKRYQSHMAQKDSPAVALGRKGGMNSRKNMTPEEASATWTRLDTPTRTRERTSGSWQRIRSCRSSGRSGYAG